MGAAWRCVQRRGWACQGPARRGLVGLEGLGKGRLGKVRRGKRSLDRKGRAWLGGARRGWVRLGEAR